MSNPKSMPRSSGGKLRVLRLLIMVMSFAGLCAMAFIILQSCSRPNMDLTRFAKGGLKKLQIFETPMPASGREFLHYNVSDEKIPATTQTLSDYRGDYVLLNLWATWCAPCIAELPSLDRFQKQYRARALRVLPISQDRHINEARQFYQKTAIKNLDLLHDPSLSFSTDVKAVGLPISILYDPSGHEIARISGEVNWQDPDVHAFFEYFLGETSKK